MTQKVFVWGGRGQQQSLWLPQGPGGIEVLQRKQIASSNSLCRTDDPLQSAFVLGSGSGEPDGDGGVDGFKDGGVKCIITDFGKLNFFLCCAFYDEGAEV